MEIEQLAKLYHEICREMVNKQIGMITKPTQPYIEWDALTEEQKEGRRFIAKGLLAKLVLYLRVPRAPKADKLEGMKELKM